MSSVRTLNPLAHRLGARVTVLLLTLLALVLTATAVGWLLVGWSLLSFLGLL